MNKRKFFKDGDLLLEVIPDDQSTGTLTKVVFGENNWWLGFILFFLGASLWFWIFNVFEWKDVWEDFVDLADEDGGLLFFGVLISFGLLVFGYVSMAVQNLWVFDLENKKFMHIKQNLLFIKTNKDQPLDELDDISFECEKEWDAEDKKWEIDCRIYAEFNNGKELESKKYTNETTSKNICERLKGYLKEYLET